MSLFYLHPCSFKRFPKSLLFSFAFTVSVSLKCVCSTRFRSFCMWHSNGARLHINIHSDHSRNRFVPLAKKKYYVVGSSVVRRRSLDCPSKSGKEPKCTNTFIKKAWKRTMLIISNFFTTELESRFLSVHCMGGHGIEYR